MIGGVSLSAEKFLECLARIVQSRDHWGLQISGVDLPLQILLTAQIRIEASGFATAVVAPRPAFVVYIVPFVSLLRQISWRLGIYSTMSFH